MNAALLLYMGLLFYFQLWNEHFSFFLVQHRIIIDIVLTTVQLHCRSSHTKGIYVLVCACLIQQLGSFSST